MTTVAIEMTIYYNDPFNGEREKTANGVAVVDDDAFENDRAGVLDCLIEAILEEAEEGYDSWTCSMYDPADDGTLLAYQQSRPTNLAEPKQGNRSVH